MSDLIKLEGSYTREQLVEALEKHDKEIEYPRCFKWKHNGEIVLFDGLKSGIIVKRGDGKYCQDVGYCSDTFIDNTSISWEEIPYNKERGFYDGQLVYCWQNGGYSIVLGIYNVALDGANIRTVDSGTPVTYSYENYSADIPEFV